MPEDKNLLFRAEYDGGDIVKGVEEVLDSLEKAQEAQTLLKVSVQETTAAMRINRQEAEKLAKLKLASPEQKKQLEELNKEYDGLVDQLTDLQIAQKKVTETSKEYAKAQREQKRNQEEISKTVSKFTNVNKVAADGVKKMGNFVKDATFSLIAGFAGGIASNVIPQVLEWVFSMGKANRELDEMKKRQALTNEIILEGSKNAFAQVTHLEALRRKLTDLNVPIKDRVRLAEEYNKIADEQNKIDTKQIDNIGQINNLIASQISLIKERALAQAAESRIVQAGIKLLDAEERARTKNLELSEQATQGIEGVTVTTNVRAPDGSLIPIVKDQAQIAAEQQAAQMRLLSELIAKDPEVIKAREEFERATQVSLGLITIPGLTTKTKTPETKAVENVYEQMLAQLRARLSAVTASKFESEPLIRKKFEDQLNKELQQIGKLLKDGKLTEPQSEILKGLLKQINDVELSKGLEEFRKKQEAAMKEVNDAIISANTELQTQRVNNLRDEFEREREQIALNYQSAVDEINRRSEDFRKKVDEDTKKGLISPEVARRKKLIAAYLFGQLLDQAEMARLNAQVDAAFKQFQKTLETAKQGFDGQLVTESEETTRQVREQVGKFLEGQITFEQYQKNLTAILKHEAATRRRIQLEEAEEALRLVKEQLKNTTDADQIKRLEAQRDALRQQISTLRREIATGAANEQNDEDKERIDKLLAYAKSIQDLAMSVINFWNQVNAAEAASLDRSIALQNRRVENARELAEKGNAELLEMEQQRLDELERKRADNARKQLAINNALATSQAIVAAITAIAQAVQTGSPLAAIAAVGAVIAAIGAAYQFANSLQPQEANFFTGTEYVEGPRGRDKVKANLTHGERVVTAKENQDYWDTLTAIHNRTIPPEALNSFVASYPRTEIPVVDFDRLSLATEGKIGYDSHELIGKVEKLNSTMEQVVVGLSEIGVSVNMDEDGFAASISKAARKRRLRSRS